MQTRLLIVSPCRPHSSANRQWPGRFDARYGDHLLVERSRTPFCDGARALIAQGLADPDDRLVMRHAGSDHDALTAKVGVAAKLTVADETGDGKPRFVRWKPHPRVSLSAPMLQNAEEVVVVPEGPQGLEYIPAPMGTLVGATGPAGP